jgi:hypothetical protein
MSNNFSRCFVFLLVFSLLAYLANYFLGPDLSAPFVGATHIFLFFVNLLLFFVFDFIARNNVDKAGFTFIFFVFVKGLLIFLFLGIIQNTIILTKSLMLSFALSYLAYLFFSIYICLKTLRFYEK